MWLSKKKSKKEISGFHINIKRKKKKFNPIQTKQRSNSFISFTLVFGFHHNGELKQKKKKKKRNVWICCLTQIS